MENINIEMDVIFAEKNERYLNVFFKTTKAVNAANIRFNKQLEIIGDDFGVILSKKSILPMKLWCKEQNLTF